uniref:Uncharacterized protein n=1 Tax=Timema monikensis TaxID=170555 RepID=A0A7R9EEQ7_9NEOP|nr:unnamed protein product [Timema monikensis]
MKDLQPVLKAVFSRISFNELFQGQSPRSIYVGTTIFMVKYHMSPKYIAEGLFQILSRVVPTLTDLRPVNTTSPPPNALSWDDTIKTYTISACCGRGNIFNMDDSVKDINQKCFLKISKSSNLQLVKNPEVIWIGFISIQSPACTQTFGWSELPALNHSAEDEPIDYFNCTQMTEFKRKAICIKQCVGIQLDILGQDGNIRESRMRQYMLQTVSSDNWKKQLATDAIDTCIASGNRSVSRKDENGVEQCNPAAMDFLYCTWAETQLVELPIQTTPSSLTLDQAVIHFIEADVRRHDANRNLESPLFVFLSRKSGGSAEEQESSGNLLGRFSQTSREVSLVTAGRAIQTGREVYLVTAGRVSQTGREVYLVTAGRVSKTSREVSLVTAGRASQTGREVSLVTAGRVSQTGREVYLVTAGRVSQTGREVYLVTAGRVSQTSREVSLVTAGRASQTGREVMRVGAGKWLAERSRQRELQWDIRMSWLRESRCWGFEISAGPSRVNDSVPNPLVKRIGGIGKNIVERLHRDLEEVLDGMHLQVMMQSHIVNVPKCVNNDSQTHALERLHPPHIRVRKVAPSGPLIVNDRPEQLPGLSYRSM